MAHVLHVHPDLVGPQGHHAAANERVLFAPVRRLILSNRLPDGGGWLPRLVDTHALRFRVRASVDGLAALTAFRGQGAVDQHEVVLHDPRHDLLPRVLKALEGLSHQQWARGLGVQAVRQATVTALVSRGVAVRVSAEVQQQPGLQRRGALLHQQLRNLLASGQRLQPRPCRVDTLGVRQTGPASRLHHHGQVAILKDDARLLAQRLLGVSRWGLGSATSRRREERPRMRRGHGWRGLALDALPLAQVGHAVVLQLVAAADVDAAAGAALDIAALLAAADAAGKLRAEGSERLAACGSPQLHILHAEPERHVPVRLAVPDGIGRVHREGPDQPLHALTRQPVPRQHQL
mmetsp:Transcript_48893/g.126058  ORF Transcript_48893/g.126058 Transcript_48893/m.126058 type:complete len:348 (-) Transcript_48893:774-1817(-)